MLLTKNLRSSYGLEVNQIYFFKLVRYPTFYWHSVMEFLKRFIEQSLICSFMLILNTINIDIGVCGL